MKTQKINENCDRLLSEISEKRKREGHPISSKTAILNDLIIKLHKKEFK